LVDIAGLAEMHLGADHAWQDMQARGLDRLSSRGAPKIANRGDFTFSNSKGALGRAILIDDRAAFDDQVIGGGHSKCRASAALPRAASGPRSGSEGLQAEEESMRAILLSDRTI